VFSDALGADDSEVAIGQVGGVEAVVACLDTEDEDLRRRAIGCLCNLTIHGI
jgi:hypothetical protein